MIVVSTKQEQGPVLVPTEAAIRFWWWCTCILELKYMTCFSFKVFAIIIEVCVLYFRTEVHLSVRSCCPVTTPSHKVFWEGLNTPKQHHISTMFSAQTNKFHFTSQKINLSLFLWLIFPPAPFFFNFFVIIFFSFVIGEFEVKQVYIYDVTLDVMLLVLWRLQKFYRIFESSIRGPGQKIRPKFYRFFEN